MFWQIKIVLFVIFVAPACSVLETQLYEHEESDGSTQYFFGDDGKIQVLFTSPFTMFNQTHWSIYISGNGLVSFSDDDLPGHYGNQGCSSTSVPKILALWADSDNNIDTTGAKLTYKETANTVKFQKAKKDIIVGFPRFQKSRLNLTWMFIVTWKNMPKHATPGVERNTFQLILTKSETQSFVILYYPQVEWSSGGLVAGFDFGSSHPFYAIPGTCGTSTQDITQNSNMGHRYPGRYVFKVDANLELPRSDSKSSNTNGEHLALLIQPRTVSIMGNYPIFIRGVFVDDDANISCIFADPTLSRPTKTKGVAVTTADESIVICPVPYLYLDIRY